MTQQLNRVAVAGPEHGSFGRRFAGHFAAQPHKVSGLKPSSLAVTEARSIFTHAVIAPEDAGRVLVPGKNQRKIGDAVVKGRWAGMPIYTLTLEERATCPRECGHFLTCYGNAMPFARRHRHGKNLELILDDELRLLAVAHPRGFVVRLHILGDFYSPHYAGLWLAWLTEIPALRIFGYTSRDPESGIGFIIRQMNGFSDRCVIRFSGEAVTADVPRARTTWTQPGANRLAEGIVCPVQTGRVETCGACALCWQSKEPIVFIAHGMQAGGRPRKVA